MKILLGITGSVATTLTGKIIRHLQGRGHEVKVIATYRADPFLQENPKALCETLWDKDEFPVGMWVYQDGDPVPHKELADWADGFLIAPCSANTLAKISTGVADNLLTTVARIWNPRKPFVIAPAMNTQMLKNRPTWLNLEWLDSRITVLWPSVRLLACGEYGCGALCDIQILGPVMEGYRWKAPMDVRTHTGDWQGLKIPTIEHPGSFGFARTHYVHPGVDLYNPGYRMFNTIASLDQPLDGLEVRAMAAGTVVAVDTFTGQHDTPPSPWWNDTFHVTVHDPVLDLNILYGEMIPETHIIPGCTVEPGTLLGRVTPVLKNPPKEAPAFHHPHMLHVELTDKDHLYTEPWGGGDPRPRHILDPTALLALIPKSSLVAGYHGEING